MTSQSARDGWVLRLEARSAAGKTLRRELDSYFYPDNVKAVAVSNLERTGLRCPPGLFEELALLFGGRTPNPGTLARARRRAGRRAARAAGGIRASTALVEAIQANQTLELKQARKGWGVYRMGEGRALVRRPTKSEARYAMKAAQHVLELGRATCEPCEALPGKPEELRATKIVTPQRTQGEPARYELREAADVVASHLPQTFQPDPRYPPNVQERQYHADQNEQRKVAMGAQNLDPSIVLGSNPTPADGPPMVTEDGLVLGGNGRSLMLKRAYAEGGAAAQRYREELERKAPFFGWPAADVRAMKEPLLVRVVLGLSRETPAAELAAAVRRYNDALTNALDPKAKAVSQARLLTPAAVERLGELLRERPDASLREVLRDKPAELVRILAGEGLVTNTNRSEWLTKSNELTDAGKDQLEGMFLGRVLGTAERYSSTSPAMLRKLERVVPHLVAVAGVNPEQDLVPLVQAALDLLNDARARGLDVDQLVNQGALFGATTPPAGAVEMARLFDGTNPRALGERFAAWAQRAAFDPRQSSMFGKPPSRDDLLKVLLGAPMRVANPAGLGVLQAHVDRHLERDALWHAERQYEPTKYVLEERELNLQLDKLRAAAATVAPDFWAEGLDHAQGSIQVGFRDNRDPASYARAVDALEVAIRPLGFKVGRSSSGGFQWVQLDVARARSAALEHGAWMKAVRDRAKQVGIRAANPSPMGAAERRRLEDLVWSKTPADYRGGSPRSVMHLGSDGTTTITELAKLTDAQLRRLAGEGRAANPAPQGLQVGVVRDNEGRAHPAVYRTEGGRRVFEAVGPAAKTSYEAALEQAKRLAKKLQLPVDELGVLEVAGGRTANPGCGCSYVPLVKTRADDVAGIAAALRKHLGEIPKQGAALVKAAGLDELLRVEFGPKGVESVRLGRRRVGALRTRLARALKTA